MNILSSEELGSSCWQTMCVYLEKELQSLRVKNDNLRLNIEETSVLRGEIKRVKTILALGNESLIQGDTPNY